MDRLQKIQRTSAVLRYLLLIATAVIALAIILTLSTPGQAWVTFGDGLFNELWHNGASDRSTLLLVTLPIVIILCLGVYWLQRLFAEYQCGFFFTNSSMRCYVWLVWLKAVNFLYAPVWYSLLTNIASPEMISDYSLNIEAGTVVEIVVLLVVVHLLKEAQQLNDENKAFV
jgi:ABC-type multidrug transport system fused ATPase/permease subunit